MEFFANFAIDKVTLSKRFGWLLNIEASEPGGTEALVFFMGICLLRRII